MSPRARIAAIFWIWLLCALPFFVFPLVEPSSWDYPRFTAGVSFCAILLSFVWRWWSDLRLSMKQKQEDELKFKDYRERILDLGETLTIRGASGLFLLIALSIADLMVIWASISETRPFFVVFAALGTPLIFFSALFVIPVIGKPPLILSRVGVEATGYGFIPWSAVEGVELQEIRSKGSTIGHILRFWVPDLSTRMAGAHPMIRMAKRLYRGKSTRDIINLKLRRTSEAPELIERLCFEFWKAATGRSYRWSIHLPEKHIALMKGADGLQHKLEVPGEDAGQLQESLRDIERRVSPILANHASEARGMRFVSECAAAIIFILVGVQITGATTNFVPSDNWAVACIVTSLLIVGLGTRLLLLRTQSRPLRAVRGLKWIGALLLSGVGLFVSVVGCWIVIQNAVGDPIARVYGASESISIIAKKTDSARRRRCDQRLTGPGLGDAVCLSRQEYERLPDQVPVDLHIRRTWVGYHVVASQVRADR
jgi:hypothetical protein